MLTYYFVCINYFIVLEGVATNPMLSLNKFFTSRGNSLKSALIPIKFESISLQSFAILGDHLLP